MNPDPEQRIKRIMSGEACGVGPALVRSVLAIAEPFYSAAARLRNHSFDSGRKTVKSLPRPVISIGNVTTGGTGKTPAVRWLAERLRDEGRHVAILSRGYKSVDAGLGDELTMLDRALNAPGKPAVLVRANPDRFIAGTRLLEQAPETNVFILDDGFQHRRLARNLDIVLINALEPFGFDHVLPRGMLREPLTSLRRADAIVVTHCDRVSAEAIGSVESTIRRYHPGVPL
ncbi:MAG TPA: tetraacyldisaccharide 4'-kinase, partial [Tepidisphaeraceae bacterium]|nr:tetraacyldisaccharide 4'-kinase [Tepidisphaeraceae bacterium]